MTPLINVLPIVQSLTHRRAKPHKLRGDFGRYNIELNLYGNLNLRSRLKKSEFTIKILRVRIPAFEVSYDAPHSRTRHDCSCAFNNDNLYIYEFDVRLMFSTETLITGVSTRALGAGRTNGVHCSIPVISSLNREHMFEFFFISKTLS